MIIRVLLPTLFVSATFLQVASSQPLFTQKGEDPSFQKVIESGKLPKGANSRLGVTGSTIDLKNELVETTPEAKRPIPKHIKIHTLGSSVIARADFAKWSRWYQEDGEEVGEGSFARPQGETSFRWGMYLGKSAVKQDAMIFVSGATVDGK